MILTVILGLMTSPTSDLFLGFWYIWSILISYSQEISINIPIFGGLDPHTIHGKNPTWHSLQSHTARCYTTGPEECCIAGVWWNFWGRDSGRLFREWKDEPWQNNMVKHGETPRFLERVGVGDGGNSFQLGCPKPCCCFQSHRVLSHW